MAVHHSNYGRILALRQSSNALDERIKSTMRLLSDTRKELLSIPAPPSDEVAREVKVDDLLAYAKFMSKTTVPPTFRRPVPKDSIALQIAEPTAGLSNGTPGKAVAQADDAAQATQQNTNGVGVSKLSQDTMAMLDPVSQLPFVPWPSQDIISIGALAHIQGMLEEGKDPTTVLSQEEQEAEDKRTAEEEESRKVEEEERLRRRRESMMAMGGHSRHAVQEDVFDPDEI